MIILREPEVVRGDVPGLLCRGMPLVYHGETDTPRDEPLRGVVVGIDPLDFAFVDYMPLPDGRTSKARTVAEVDSPESGMRRIVEVDWTSPAALDGALRWLADRGHICGWMRPRVYGGCIDDHGDLPAGTVSAILVARSVLEVAAGRGPVVALRGPWVTFDNNPAARWLDACGFTLRVVPADRLDVVDALDSAPPETVALVRRMLRSLPEKLEEAERMLLAMIDRRAGGGS